MSSKKTSLLFGLIQVNIGADPISTRKQVLSLLQKASKRKPDWIVLPEMVLGAPSSPSERNDWSRVYAESLVLFQNWARQNKIGLYFSELEKEGKAYFNRAVSVGPDGKVKTRYRKIHLFSFGGENRIFSAGSKAQVHQKGTGPIDGIICYDLRFPELTRHLARRGMKVLLVCAQWPQDRIEHWLTLLRARAIENQCFVIGVNRLGTKRKIRFNGNSAVYSPWGNELTRLKTEKIGFCKINLSEADAVRKRYPFLKERRLS